MRIAANCSPTIPTSKRLTSNRRSLLLLHPWTTRSTFTLARREANSARPGAAVVRELLHGFQGVLVSHFYAGYDALDCRQQKGWVHLIRDLNEDLWKFPFDEELQKFVSAVKDLIVPIIEAIHRWGGG
ncbi:MAG: transposase [Acidobacteria bacterium]|nr:transposase [Acidobacteriota bacterium]